MKILFILILYFTQFTSSRPHIPSPHMKKRPRAREDGEQPESESEITYAEFESMHDYGNYTEKFYVLKLSEKYFPDRFRNISKRMFINMCRDYSVYDLVESHYNLTFPTIAQLNDLINHHIFRDHFTNFEKGKEFTFRHMYHYTIGGRLASLLVERIHLDDLPAELQSKLKEHHKDMPEYEFDMMFRYHGARSTKKAAELIDLKHKELKRKFQERYRGIEWDLDGRRVIDDDYDELEPKYERKIHTYRVKEKENLSDDEVDMLLEEDL